MAGKSLSAKLVNAKIMMEVLKVNQAKLIKIDTPFIEEMEFLRNEVEKLNIDENA